MKVIDQPTPSKSNLASATEILDFGHPTIQQLISDRGWSTLGEEARVRSIYYFVRDEIVFGYNKRDDLGASRVLRDGYGQCNTKATLFMALLRGSNIPCRIRGFTIDKELQRGAITGLAYRLAPREILHSWVEVPIDGTWLNLEGFILDRRYLNSVQERFLGAPQQPFCGYGVAVADLSNPEVEWTGRDTYVQREGIVRDLGVFNDPDDFYAKYGGNLSGIRQFVFERVVRHRMNATVSRIRESGT